MLQQLTIINISNYLNFHIHFFFIICFNLMLRPSQAQWSCIIANATWKWVSWKWTWCFFLSFCFCSVFHIKFIWLKSLSHLRYAKIIEFRSVYCLQFYNDFFHHLRMLCLYLLVLDELARLNWIFNSIEINMG